MLTTVLVSTKKYVLFKYFFSTLSIFINFDIHEYYKKDFFAEWDFPWPSKFGLLRDIYGRCIEMCDKALLMVGKY